MRDILFVGLISMISAAADGETERDTWILLKVLAEMTGDTSMPLSSLVLLNMRK